MRTKRSSDTGLEIAASLAAEDQLEESQLFASAAPRQLSTGGSAQALKAACWRLSMGAPLISPGYLQEAPSLSAAR